MNRSILGLFSIKFISTFFAALYSVLQIRYFGATRGIEVFFVAQSLLYLITSLSQSGHLAEVYLPLYLELQNSYGRNAAFASLNVVLCRLLVFGLFGVLFFWTTSSAWVYLFAPGYNEVDAEQVSLIFSCLLPAVLLQILNSFLLMVLNGESKFGRGELVGAVNSFLNLVLLFFLFESIGIWVMVIAFLTGKLIEFALYLWQLYRLGFKFYFIRVYEHFDHKSFFRSMRSTFLYVATVQLSSLSLTACVSFLPEGMFALYKYAENITLKLRGLMVQPFITVFFTEVGRLVEKKLDSVLVYFRSVWYVSSIAFSGIAIFGIYLVDFLWGDETFSSLDKTILNHMLFVFGLTVIVSSIGGLYRKFVVSLGKGRMLYNWWSFAQVLNALATLLLVYFFRTRGLILVPIVTYGTVATVSYHIAKRQTGRSFMSILKIRSTLRGLALIVLGAIAYGNSALTELFLLNLLMIVMFLVFSLMLIRETLNGLT